MFLLENIKEFEDGYKVEQVNCLEKPLLILLYNYNEVYSHCFLAFHKLLQSYLINSYEHFNNDITMNRAGKILKKEFDINLKCEEVINDINEFIRIQIDNNNPVIIPVDLYELYYSKHYKNSHWIHSFLIYKYDNINSIYYIVDATQQFDDTYHKFTIPFDMLEKMYFSFNNYIYHTGIYYIESDSVNLKPDVMNFINKILLYYFKAEPKEVCREIEILSDYKAQKLSKQEITKRLLQIKNYKNVLYNELEWMLNQTNINNVLKEKYNHLKCNLIKNWKEISGKLTYYIYKSDFSIIIRLLEPVLCAEGDMLNFLSLLPDDVMFNKSVTCDIKDSFIVDNNQDNIISMSDNWIVFKFDTNKIYDNWTKDNAPKILYSENDIRNKILNASVKLDLTSCRTGANYMAGFYIKTEKSSTYLCGVNSGVCISMDQSGINPNIFIIDRCSQKLNMKIIIINEAIRFECVDLNNNERLTIKEIILDSVACEFGIACKTWGGYTSLKMVFSDFNIELN